MQDYGELLKKSYEYLNTGKIKEAEKGFTEIYNALSKEEDLNEGSNTYSHFLSSITGLGVIDMQNGDMEASLEKFLEGNKVSEGKDFSILFNLGVVYTNLQDFENANKFIEKAKKINPKDSNLVRFLLENDLSGNGKGEENTENSKDNRNEVDKSFEDKVAKMIEKLK